MPSDFTGTIVAGNQRYRGTITVPVSIQGFPYLKVLSVWYTDFSRRTVHVQLSSLSAAVAQRLMRASRFYKRLLSAAAGGEGEAEWVE